MRITFFGAAQNVTGSKHLIESGGFRLLLDCGLHQGKRFDADALNRTLPFSAGDVSATILSHAHADHCGMLPLLVKNGYRNKIFATPATAAIARLIMLDSAKIQLHDYLNMQKRAVADTKILPPLYSAEDAEEAARYFAPLPYAHATHAWQPLDQRCRFKFYDAGHILGSAVTVVQCDEPGGTTTLAYTGDLGNTHVPLLHEPEIIAEPVDTLIIECTYGNKNHRPIAEIADHLKEIIRDAVQNKRKIIIPAFALGRTQELIYILHKLYHQGEIPVIPIYLDSPLASDITNVYASHQEDFDQDTWTDFISRNESPFSFQNLRTLQTVEESKALVAASGPFMVIASSGMAEGGRIVDHLERGVSDPNTIIMITGYQAENTLGRKLQDGITPVRIYDRTYDVRARVVIVDELSAHADQRGLLAYVSRTKNLQKIFLVHSELPQAMAFKEILTQHFPALDITIPAVGQSFEV
ncbi:MAG: MBL fold metallo-hydrolase [Patescibacteria group bacterium]|nr:MBL fold metallo-hydrolase [Patescibacteria group bacterium]